MWKLRALRLWWLVRLAAKRKCKHGRAMESPTKSFSKWLSKVWEAKKKKSHVRTKILTDSEVPWEPKGRKEQIILWWICSHIIQASASSVSSGISFVLCSLLLWPTINLFLFSEVVGITWVLFSGLIQLTIGCVNWAALLGCFVHLSMFNDRESTCTPLSSTLLCVFKKVQQKFPPEPACPFVRASLPTSPLSHWDRLFIITSFSHSTLQVCKALMSLCVWH